MTRPGDRWWPPPSRPLPAEGGIRSRSRRGSFAESWWGRRWIEVLEGFRIGARLGRGRSYARQGQVLGIEVEPGAVGARVQGSRAEPYRVRIALEPLGGSERRAVAGELARRPRVAASLFAGEMPREVEDAFADAGVPLFPERHGDLATECSCPDWSNPCKHVAAVYYLVAEELDRNPFLLLRLRGLARSDLAEASGGAGEAEGSGAPGGAAPLPEDPDLFWKGGRTGGGGPRADDEAEAGGELPELLTAEPDAAPAAHLRALGRVPFWRGETDPEEALEEMTRRAAALALALLAGEEEGSDGQDGGDAPEPS